MLINRKPSRAEQILTHALKYCTPCQSHEGLPCALHPATPFVQEILPIRSVLFRDWLADSFHREHDLFPGSASLRHAIKLFEGKARRSELPRKSLALRTTYQGDPLNPTAILIDLANHDAESIHITQEGWQITTAQHSFRRTEFQHAIPAPVPSPDPPAPFPAAAAAWLLTALKPTGPYPILVLKGPAGAGKTLLAHKLRTLIDPATSTFSPLPHSEDDLLRHAWNNHILALDHAHRLSPKIAAALCRLSSGAPFHFDSVPIPLRRPIILTVPDDDHLLRHIANHAITIDLPPIKAAQRRTERDLLQEFEAQRPALLGSLCTAISLALGNVNATSLEFPSRFADASQFAIAAAPALGISEHAMRATLTPDPLAREVANFAYEQQHWEGTATELLETLRAAQVPNLPASPIQLSRRLHHAPLATLGVALDMWRTPNQRKIRMTIAAHSIVMKSQCA